MIATISRNVFRVYYGSVLVGTVLAETSYEAIERVQCKLTEYYPDLKRKAFNAKKV
jgi:hypothetical protein